MEIEYPVWEHMKQNLPTIKAMAKLIKEQKYRKPLLVCMGSSGAIIAGIISIKFRRTIPIYYIRKDGEEGHNTHFDTTKLDKRTLIIVDDFVSSGATVARILKKLNKIGISKVQALCVAQMHIPEDYFESEITDFLIPTYE